MIQYLPNYLLTEMQGFFLPDLVSLGEGVEVMVLFQRSSQVAPLNLNVALQAIKNRYIESLVLPGDAQGGTQFILRAVMGREGMGECQDSRHSQ